MHSVTTKLYIGSWILLSCNILMHLGSRMDNDTDNNGGPSHVSFSDTFSTASFIQHRKTINKFSSKDEAFALGTRTNENASHMSNKSLSVLRRGELFRVTHGLCKTVGPNCVTSPNFPKNYLIRQKCQISIDPNAWAGKYIEVLSFLTQRAHDTLRINDILYSGTGGPRWVTPTNTIEWSSDNSIVNRGWKLCAVTATNEVKATDAPCDNNTQK